MYCTYMYAFTYMCESGGPKRHLRTLLQHLRGPSTTYTCTLLLCTYMVSSTTPAVLYMVFALKAWLLANFTNEDIEQ